MVDARPVSSDRSICDPIDLLITRVDVLIQDASKIDPVSAALLGLAKVELIKGKALKAGAIAEFKPPPSGR